MPGKHSGFKMKGWSPFTKDEKPTSGEVTQVQNLLYEMETNPGNYPIPPDTQKTLDKYPGFNWGEGEKIKKYRKK